MLIVFDDVLVCVDSVSVERQVPTVFSDVPIRAECGVPGDDRVRRCACSC